MSDVPYVPVVIAPDAARDARVTARRAADARKAGAALDALLSDDGSALVMMGYNNGWSDGYLASVEHHNRHYVVPDSGPDDHRDT